MCELQLAVYVLQINKVREKLAYVQSNIHIFFHIEKLNKWNQTGWNNNCRDTWQHQTTSLWTLWDTFTYSHRAWEKPDNLSRNLSPCNKEVLGRLITIIKELWLEGKWLDIQVWWNCKLLAGLTNALSGLTLNYSALHIFLFARRLLAVRGQS